MNEATDVRSRHEKKVLGYLRWYPAAWRERYGEEFAAHLEAELDEEPFSMKRGLNIVLHGVATRLQLQRAVRWFTGVGAVVVGVVAVLTLLAVQSVPPALALAPSNVTGVGFMTSTTQLSAVIFNFRAPARQKIRIVSVKVIGVPGWTAPLVGAVDISNQSLDIVNPPGWPAVIPKAAVTGTTPLRLRPAIGPLVVLNKSNALVVGFRTPLNKTAYAIGGISVTYLHNGHHYVASLNWNLNSVVMCTGPSSKVSFPNWCSADVSAVQLTEENMHPSMLNPSWSAPERTANAVYGAAAGLGLASHERMTLHQMRYLANIMAPASLPAGIQKIILTQNGIFHIFFRGATTTSQTQVCIRRDDYNPRDYISAYSPGSCTASSGVQGSLIAGSNDN
jgi:hypothetical protein